MSLVSNYVWSKLSATFLKSPCRETGCSNFRLEVILYSPKAVYISTVIFHAFVLVFIISGLLDNKLSWMHAVLHYVSSDSSQFLNKL